MNRVDARAQLTHPEDNDVLEEARAWVEANEVKPMDEVIAAIVAIVGLVVLFYVMRLGFVVMP